MLLPLLGAQCVERPPPPPPPVVAPPTPTVKKMDAVDAKHRAKAAELGLARADSAEMDHVDEFLCSKLLPALLAAKTSPERRALAADVDVYGCRDRKEWGEIATRRAAELGMTEVHAASMRALQAYVCGRLADAARAASGKSASLDVEREIFGCEGAR